MFRLLKKELREECDKQKEQMFDSLNELDRLRAMSTDTRWEQYKAGQITLEQLRGYAKAREEKRLEKEYQKHVDELDAVAAAGVLRSISIIVEWSRGGHPTATCSVYSSAGYEETTGRAGGWGYDKTSTAVGEALNKSLAVRKALFKYKEARLKEGLSDRRDSVCTGRDNRDIIGYGAGYAILPYFESGVGVGCFWRIFNKMGFEVHENRRAKSTDYFRIDKNG